MQVIEITEFGGPDVLKPALRPKPTAKAGEVLIAVKAAGVNRPDVIQRLGNYPAPKGASDIPGLEVAGTVVATGSGVQGLKVGDAVCALVQGGGYSEYVTAPIETVLPIPEGLSFVEAAALPETFYTVWSNVFDRAGLKAGERFLVHGGSSGIGSTAIQLAKAFGAEVFTTVGGVDKAAFCKTLGADVVIEYNKQDYVEIINQHTGGAGVDVVLDMVGGDYINRNLSVLAVEGRHVSIAFLSGAKTEVNMLPVMIKRLVITGSTLRARDKTFKGAIATSLYKKVWPLLKDGKVKPVIDSIFPFEQAADAHKLMETSAHKGKIVLTVGK
ncbi:NAD(P)H-quinone oxidoreductase [Kordiimonas pumila]|uniref:NAD(P)H-quinone oxidoreductase n=1 Tax=Kordiimonas pumila TaxID=2161677 RepID=A0ABV7D6D3_9PROT